MTDKCLRAGFYFHTFIFDIFPIEAQVYMLRLRAFPLNYDYGAMLTPFLDTPRD